MACVIVLGPHRSGTSLVARILQNAGVNMGERFRESDEFNPEGYCEDLDFKELNQKILKSMRSTWWNPPLTKPTYDLVPDECCEQIEELIEARTAEHEVWGFKDPRMAVLLGLYRHHLPSDTKYVVVSRNVWDITKSLYKREQLKKRGRTKDDGYAVSYWTELTQRYYSSIMSYLAAGMLDAFIINYRDLTDVYNASVTVSLLYDWIGHPPEDGALSKSLGMIKYENKL